MPELPEVEIARRQLTRWMAGRRIAHVVAQKTRVLRGTSPQQLVAALEGRTVLSAQRRGKVLLLGLDNHHGLMIHLGMTGKFVLGAKSEEAPPPFARTSFTLEESGQTIHYVDMRVFGRLLPVATDQIDQLPQVRSMGPDPLLDGLTPAMLAARLRNTARPVKVALMDQAVVAGVGNIQATEALWRACIPPDLPARELDDQDLERLAPAIIVSIKETLAADLDSDEMHYLEESGTENPFIIYRQHGTPCPRCGTTMERTVLGGRGTVFCPSCQSHDRRSSRCFQFPEP